MKAQVITYLTFIAFAFICELNANVDYFLDCKKECDSCTSGDCDTESSTYGEGVNHPMQDVPFDSYAAAANAKAILEEQGWECDIITKNSYDYGGVNSGTVTSPGITTLNYKREGLIFEGVNPGYVKYEVVQETQNGITTSVKKPIQLPTKSHTVFYSDLADGSGYQAARYLNSQISEADANGLRTIPAGVVPVSIIIYRNPDGSADTTNGNMEVVTKQRHPQTGAWVTKTIRKTAPQNDNNWKTEFYLGDPTQNPTLLTYREITITRTPHQDGTESTREVTKDRDTFGTLVITSDLSSTYGFYKYGHPVKLSQTKHTGTGSDLTLNYTYFTDAGEQASFNKRATLRGSDGQWANYTYQGSTVTGILMTKVVSGWLDNAAPAIGSAPDEAANKVVTVIEARNETGTFSREEKIQGVLVSKTWGERYIDNSKQLVEKTRVETGATTLTTTRIGYPYDESVKEADRGRLKSVQYPNGTLALHSHVMNGENLVVTIDSGAGTLDGVIDGTRTVSTYTHDDTLIEEKTIDIISGVVLSERTAIAFDANEQPTRWAYFSNPEDYSEAINGCCGVDSTRSREGVVTTYTRDGLKRPKTAVSQGITMTYTYGSVDIGGTLFPSTNVTHTAGGLTLDQGTTIYDHAGSVIQSIAPDRDGDGNDEITTVARDYTTRTTTTTNPDGGTTVSVRHIDGQNKSTTGTATTPSYYAYSTHSERGGGRLTSMAPTASGPWSHTYVNLAGRTLKTSYDDGSSELVLTSYGYDSIGRIVSMTDADGVTSLTAYNAEGEAYQRAIDLNQNGQIDTADRITESNRDVISDSLIGDAIRTVSIIYDLSGAALTTSTSYLSPDGLNAHQETLGLTNPSTSSSASYTDRADGTWVDTSTSPDGSKTTVSYQNWLAVTQTMLNASDNTIASTTTGYDALRRAITHTDSRTAASVVTRTNYHASNGQVTSLEEDLTVGASRTTSFTYDAMGRRVTTTLPDNSSTHTSYTLRGETLATWGSQTYARLYQYDARGRMSELRTYQDLAHGTEPTAATTGYATTTWIYDGRSQLTRKEYDDGNGTDYTYAPAGRLKTRKWARGNWTRYDYDTAGALSATLYFTAATTESAMLAATSGNDPQTPDVIVTNDKLGRPTTVTQAGNTHTYSYDPTTLILDTETIAYDTDGNGSSDFTRILDRLFDTLQRPTGWTLNDGTTTEHSVTYGYHNDDSRLNTVVSHGQTHTYGYETNSYGLVGTVTSPSHTVTNTYEFSRNVLVNKENKAGNNIRSNYLYTTNAIGQRTNLTANGDAFGTAPIYNWAYNGAGELISVDDTSAANNDRAFEYDGIGNRKKSANNLTLPASDNYTTNNLNQYTVAPNALTTSYDTDGNMTSGPLPSHTGGNPTLIWDGENRLISTTVNGITTTYGYDYQSRRISKTTTTTTTRYIYEGWNPIAEYTGITLNKSYTWGMDLSGSMQGAGGVGGVGGLLAVNDGTANYYPTYDGNGNVSEYLDSTGEAVAHYEYDAFGNTIVSTGSKTADFSHRFSTKPQDSETGLYYYGYRYYDPTNGRWPNRDPIEEQGGFNIYGFVGNDAVNKLDLLGLWIRNNNWKGQRGEYQGTCCAETGDTVAELAAKITGKSGDASLLGVTTVEAGQAIDISPLLKKLEERLRKAVVANTSKFNTSGPFENFPDEDLEDRLDDYFKPNCKHPADCVKAVDAVTLKSLKDVLPGVTFASLKQNKIKVPADARKGDWTWIQGYITDTTSPWIGENVIKVDNKKWWGYTGTSQIKSIPDWVAFLKGGGKPTKNWDTDPEGFKADQVYFYDVPKIAAEHFDKK